MQRHFCGVIVLHPRFEGDRSHNHYPKYSLILRVFHYPTPEGKRRGPRLSILDSASFSGSFITLSQREGERPHPPYPIYSLILRVFHYPTPEGKRRDPRLSILDIASFSGSFITPPQRERGETTDSLFFIQPHSQGLSLPHPIGKGERPQTPYSSYSL